MKRRLDILGKERRGGMKCEARRGDIVEVNGGGERKEGKGAGWLGKCVCSGGRDSNICNWKFQCSFH